MNRKELLTVLESIGMRPGRGLGQNFLVDSNLLDSIVRDAAPKPGEVVLEVGPGFGALTRKLLESGAEVYAVEFDHRIAEYLRKNLPHERLHLIEDDACRVDFTKILPREKPFRSIANLPYSISSIFLARLLELPEPPREMIFMLQREMADRLAAAPGCKAYGALSVRTQYDYQVRILRAVPPEVFFPPPEVDSAVVGFSRLDNGSDVQFRRHLGGVVKTAFAQRRKQMGKVLGANYGREKIEKIFAELDLPMEIRPDRVDVSTFAALTEKLFQ
ncbi:MAG: ribosomal RNA small subunit methyltransferase A [Lentisphaeria bacterium]|nr:ribosomal RNA small subunit methyltransferase A [Lentisphaeria bacterium]